MLPPNNLRMINVTCEKNYLPYKTSSFDLLCEGKNCFFLTVLINNKTQYLYRDLAISFRFLKSVGIEHSIFQNKKQIKEILLVACGYYLETKKTETIEIEDKIENKIEIELCLVFDVQYKVFVFLYFFVTVDKTE